MGNRKPPKKSPPKKPKPKFSPTSSPSFSPPPPSTSPLSLSQAPPPPSESVAANGCLALEVSDSLDAQLTVPRTDLAINTVSDLSSIVSDLDSVAPVKVDSSSGLAATDSEQMVPTARDSAPPTANVGPSAKPVIAKVAAAGNSDSWVKTVMGSSKQLKRKGTAFTLDSGEACVRIPNSVIERNKTSWECFIIGQFYYDPPSQGTIHNIVNGIWSKHFRDIAVSKMEGNAFLFRIPNAATRNRVLSQRLWQIEGQTMFVAKWDPGVIPVKPELTSAPIWLELRKVPLQFFNEECLEHIASLVGEPRLLHPSTANKTNLEVAKVFTIIDPRKPLPEAVNVQFDSGAISRVLVSSLWMPPVCAHCKEVGHSLKYCKKAPITCKTCSSTTHSMELCPRANAAGPKKRRNQHKPRSKSPVSFPIVAKPPLKGKEKGTKEWVAKEGHTIAVPGVVTENPESFSVKDTGLSLGSGSVLLHGESSGKGISTDKSPQSTVLSSPEKVQSSDSEVEQDSSDISSRNSEEDDFVEVLSKRQRKVLRGKGLKHTSI